MSLYNIIEISKRNRETFRDSATGKLTPVLGRQSLFVFLSILFGISIKNNLNDFLAGVLTFQSILIGTSFSVMFFMASSFSNDYREGEGISDTLRENALRREKVDIVVRELFANVSYFNVVAIACAIFSIALMSPQINFLYLFDIISIFINFDYNDIVSRNVQMFVSYLSLLVRVIFFLLLIESAFSFGRIVIRVNFLFRSKVGYRGSASNE